MKILQTKLLMAAIMLSVPMSYATVILNDSFNAAEVGYGLNDAANGEYRSAVALNHTNNAGVSGGGIVGFSSTNYWAGNSGNPIVYQTGLSSSSVTGSGGSISMRGGNDTVNRYQGRQVSAYGSPSSLYLSATLSATMLDDNAVSLVGFSSWLSTDAGARPNAILDNSGTFYNGLAVGFKGNGVGGMDLIVRYRDGSLNYIDTVLKSSIAANTSYTIAGKIDWNDPGTLGGSRDPFTIWVDPASSSEPVTGGTSLLGFLGDPSTLNAVYVMQKNYGSGLSDTVYVDEIRMASSYPDLNMIPEPTTISLLAFAGISIALIRRNRKA